MGLHSGEGSRGGRRGLRQLQSMGYSPTWLDAAWSVCGAQLAKMLAAQALAQAQAQESHTHVRECELRHVYDRSRRSAC